MVKLFANNGIPNQMLCSATSDLGLQSLPVTLFGVSRLKWVDSEFESWTPVIMLRTPIFYRIIKPNIVGLLFLAESSFEPHVFKSLMRNLTSKNLQATPSTPF